MKTAYRVIALVFTSFALVQYNDPDPWVWMLLYGAVALLFGWAAIGRLYRRAAQAGFFLTLIWAATYLPAFWDWLQMGTPSIVETMKAEQPYVELTREFLGLVLAAGAFGYLAWKNQAPTQNK